MLASRPAVETVSDSPSRGPRAEGFERKMTTDPASEKRTIRRAMRDALRQIPRERSWSAGAALAARLVRLEIWRAAPQVAIFASRNDEIDTHPIWLQARHAGKPVLLPRMTVAGTLEFAAAVEAELVSSARYGILEPASVSPTLALSRSDLVLVPGVAFDRRGGRLGRGGGYYDRTFAGGRLRGACPILIGVGFSFQVVDRVPMTALDVRMDGVASEEEFVRVEDSGREDPK